ncbi:hypothetical protein A6768_24915 [Sphingobium yanoikuyae]|uniref:Uncharacterized protein n=1 Tax=Sphingobium yanoikuyae TaxID=13690 RepID=A0A291N6Z8_SPHYA|nr:hypothetical protein A6768_16745 [Sphingobium yanoikuyae]ATI82920.1 hypothetical protein A6768_24915 [Sphingobium yanoikuyae]
MQINGKGDVMLSVLSGLVPHSSALATKGFMPLYRAGEPNRCPGCGGQQWIVGRMMAECGYCGSAVPMESFSTYSASPRITRHDYQADYALPPELRVVV